MAKCPNCGHENRDGAQFCISCGVTLTSPPSQPATPEMTGPATPMPGEPDMAQLLALLPELDIKTADLQIPVPDIDVNTEVERLTRLNLDEQIRIIQQLAQQIEAGQSKQVKS